jgi:tape measure domain-containing protein
MRHHSLTLLLLAAAAVAAAGGVARADCEADLIQLEQAYKAPKLTGEARKALDEAKAKAVSALKKDDDSTCHKAIADGMSKAGMTLK